MIKEKIKWLDPITQQMLIVILAMIVSLIMKEVFLGGILFFVGGIRGLYAGLKEPGLILENEYSHDFFIQSPNDQLNPVKIQPHSALPIPAQLIYINNKIFKVYHGTHIKITKDGNIITYSPISRLLNEYIDSKKLNKKEKEWLNKIFQLT